MDTIDEMCNIYFPGNEDVRNKLKSLLTVNFGGYNINEDFLVAVLDVFIAVHKRYKNWINLKFIQSVNWYYGKYMYEKVWEGKHIPLLSVINKLFIFGFMSELKDKTIEEFILNNKLTSFIDEYFWLYSETSNYSTEDIDLDYIIDCYGWNASGDDSGYGGSFSISRTPEIAKGLGMGELTFLRQLKLAVDEV